ncbi:Na+/H+ antiporter subunit E [Microbacterium sp. 179-B 1A2 NHS]|uniref:Na+/H+ antiporter subunit E n=1 Tax=Microbacterium sp. 179-B 1A2 NHS TaxID=3142383 RepID=UPI00399FCFCE
MPTERRRSALTGLWRQLPFFVWLIAVWMMLWGQVTLLAFLTGAVVAVFVTLVYRLPPVELSGRLNPWWLLVFVLQFIGALVRGSLIVAWQVIDPRRQPGTAVIAVPLVTDDDLIMAHVGITASLIPGSLVLETDRDRRVIYLHVLGTRSEADVEHHRQSVQLWEHRLVRAVGSPAQLAAVRAARAARSAGQPASEASR